MALPPLTARPHAFYIRPAPGWLGVLAEEVKTLLATPFQTYKYEAKFSVLKGTVKVHRCDLRQGLELLMRLKCAHDVEWLALESKCAKWSELEAILARVPWDEWVPLKTAAENLAHITPKLSQSFTTATAKVREKFTEASGLTHVSEAPPDIAPLRVKVEVGGNFLRLLVSLAGEPLYKRGYKTALSAVAPLPEHHAACLVAWVMAQGTEPQGLRPEAVYVPFAGSGTLGFEALNFFAATGPGSFSRAFACERFPKFPPATLGFLRKRMITRLTATDLPRLYLNEFNQEALQSLRANTESFALASRTEILEGDFFELSPPAETQKKKSVLLLNPPYGDRLAKDSAVTGLYRRIGENARDYLAGGCLCPSESTWRAFLTALGAGRQIETHHFTHGGKEIRAVRWYKE